MIDWKDAQTNPLPEDGTLILRWIAEESDPSPYGLNFGAEDRAHAVSCIQLGWVSHFAVINPPIA